MGGARDWRGRRPPRPLLVAAVLVAVAGIAAAVSHDGEPATPVVASADAASAAEAAPSPSTTATSVTTATTAASTTVAPTALSTSTTAAPTTAPPPPPTTTTAPAKAVERFTIDPYRGLGAWLDVFDWSWSFTGGRPQAGPADVDRMAGLGVRTLYIQISRYDHPADVVDLDLLQPIIDRAHARGVAVVGWYLPTLTDPAADLRRILAMASLPIEGVGIDIESRDVQPVAERNARLIALSAQLRSALPGQVLSAIVLPPVVMEDVNPDYWPGFPWRELAPYYDVWQTMGYWTNRRSDSGWRDGYAYTAANIDRVRQHIGWLDAPVHPIGGIGDESTPEQIAGMVQASRERGALGGSIYDYRTTHDALWAHLKPFRR